MLVEKQQEIMILLQYDCQQKKEHLLFDRIKMQHLLLIFQFPKD